MIWHKQLYTLFLLLIVNFVVAQPSGKQLNEQKTQSFFSQLADHYELPSAKDDKAQKYYWPYIMARFDRYGQKDDLAQKHIRFFAKDTPYPNGMIGFVRMLYLYNESPAVRINMQAMIKSAFDQEDSHNAWNGEGTEVQVSMARTSGYLLAQKALIYGDYFDGVTEKMADMKNWILDWSSRIYEVGTGDFNSSVDEAYLIAGWLNLYDFAVDEDIRLAARAVLDYYSAEMALHYSFGLVGGAEMNGTSAERQKETATYFLNWFWFSPSSAVDFTGREYAQLIYAVTSSYRPPQILVNYVRHSPNSPKWYKNSKPAYLLDQPSFNKEFYYKTANYTLGSLVSTYGGYTRPAGNIVNWKLIVNNRDTLVELRGNGAFWGNSNGLGKDPWTQWAQHKNILIQLTKVPVDADDLYDDIDHLCESWNRKWKRDFKKRFPNDRTKKEVYKQPDGIRIENKSYISFPKELRIKEENGIWFIDLGVVYVSMVGIPAYQNTNIENVNAKSVLTMKNQRGELCGFALEAHEAKNFADFDAFQSQFMREHIMYLDPDSRIVTYQSMDGIHLEMLVQDVGFFQEPIVDWGFGINKPQVLQHLSQFKQPEWPVRAGTGRLPGFLVENEQLDFDKRWAVFSGPVINLEHSVLSVSFNNELYEVDYSGNLPIFKGGE